MLLYNKLLFCTIFAFIIGSKIRKHKKRNPETLYAVHILFRHGERTPQRTYPNDIYKNQNYFPYGFGELTKKGRNRMFELGISLKKRYQKFWGSAVYNQSKIDALSSSYSRTRKSCQLVLAGMFPPSPLEQWNPDLEWQPTLCDYTPAEEDYVFLSEKNCHVLPLKAVEMERDRILGKFDQFEDLFKYLSDNSGLKIVTPADVTTLYDILRCQDEMKMRLPDWSSKVFPTPMNNLSVIDWDYSIKTDDLKRFGAGVLLKAIVDNTQRKMNNTLGYSTKKIFIYSGHDSNLVPMLSILGIYQRKIMPYATTIMLEVHYINKKFIVKVYLQDQDVWNPRYVPLPNCEKNCTWDKFIKSYKKYFGTKDMCL